MDRSLFLSRTVNKGTIFTAAHILAAVVIFFTFLIPQPANSDTPSASILKWAIINAPGGYPQRNDIHTPCEINCISSSPDGKVIYAVDIPNSSTGPVVNAGIWKSCDGGISWSLRPSRWLAQTAPGPAFPVADIALAPDNPDFIAAVCMDAAGTQRREVYLSNDGGINWVYSGKVPFIYGASEQFGKITITASYQNHESTVRDIIAGSRNPADGIAQGEIYILTYPGLAGWKAQGFPNGDIITVLPSPDYPADPTILAMSSTTQRTYINLGSRDTGGNACFWNTDQAWPVEMCSPDQQGGTGSGESKIITGSMAVPEDFNGNSTDKRIIFASYDSNGSSIGPSQPLDDVYRLNDTVVTRLKVPGYGNNPRICSISYTGTTKSGKLAAGGVTSDPITAAATVWLTGNPLADCPVWQKPLKPPTGGYKTGYANVQAAWTEDGKRIFAATGSGNRDTPGKWANPTDHSWNSQPLDESAFSVSMDDGTSWNQLGLVDTRINRFRSFVASEDGTTVYISSVNDNGLDSTWRCNTPLIGDAWQRVNCIECSAPLLRIAPDKTAGSTVFLGSQGTSSISRSTDSGQTWQKCNPGAILQDMSAVNTDRLYILQANGLFRKGTFETSGWRWSNFKDTGLSPAHNITAQENNILVGAAVGQDPPLSYSLDNGDTWTFITQHCYSSGNKHPVFDTEFRDNRIIYLADDAGGLYRWSIGTSTRWDDLCPTSNSYYGVATGKRAVLYAAFSPKSTGVDRTIYSRAGLPKSGISWDSLTTGLEPGVVFRLEPSALVYADDTIWAIDSRDYSPGTFTGCLWAFRDTLAGHSPWLIAPKADSLINCDPVTGRNAQVDLKWQQLSLASAYEIEIAKDKWFDLLVENASPITSPFYQPPDLLYPAYYIPDGALPEAGHSYWWRVRVRQAATGQVIRSNWSYVLSFGVRPGFKVSTSSYPGIQSLAPCHNARDVPIHAVSFSWSPLQGTDSYRFVLAEDPGLENPIIDEMVDTPAYRLHTQLRHNTSYFWQVTPAKPIPGDPSPVFSFVTQDRTDTSLQISSGSATTDALLIASNAVILFALWVQIMIFRRRQMSD